MQKMRTSNRSRKRPSRRRSKPRSRRSRRAYRSTSPVKLIQKLRSFKKGIESPLPARINPDELKNTKRYVLKPGSRIEQPFQSDNAKDHEEADRLLAALEDEYMDIPVEWLEDDGKNDEDDMLTAAVGELGDSEMSEIQTELRNAVKNSVLNEHDKQFKKNNKFNLTNFAAQQAKQYQLQVPGVLRWLTDHRKKLQIAFQNAKKIDDTYRKLLNENPDLKTKTLVEIGDRIAQLVKLDPKVVTRRLYKRSARGYL